MLGIATVDTSGLEMRMASNSRDHQFAFEAAEHALSFLEDQISLTGFSNQSLANQSCGSVCFESSCSGGYCFNGSQPLEWNNCRLNAMVTEPYESELLWRDQSGFHQSLALDRINVKYIVEFRCYTSLDDAVPMSATNFTQVYRITVFASGPAGRGRAMLRSTLKLL
jgi:type IV pilus assembly protein PilX